MRVAADRIRIGDSSQVALEARRDRGSSAPRSIDVKPQILRPAEARQFRQRIDHPRRSGPCGSDHKERSQSRFAILSDSPCEVVKIHLQIAIHRYCPKRSASQARHTRNLQESVMGPARQVDGWRFTQLPETPFDIVWKGPRQGYEHRRKIRFAAAAGKIRNRVSWKTELAA